jgi:tRNA1Val (adenine37-N6)-methyltransferase
MGNQYFKFKQFLINQDKCAMKVGTDSVLLACLTGVKNTNNVLDIGTGTGIISLMLAQKNNVLKIDAIEIDELAYQQAKENFENSPFNKQINIHFGAVQQFEANTKYDLIITNPPYFINKNNHSIINLQRAKARHDNELSFEEIIEKAYELLALNGLLNLILPLNEAIIFKKLALAKGFFCQQIINIKPKRNKEINRVIFSFSKQFCIEHTQEFVIYNPDNSQTKDYIELTKDFYL